MFHVRLQGLKTVTEKRYTPHNLVVFFIDFFLEGNAAFIFSIVFSSEAGRSTLIRNVSKLLPDYKVSHAKIKYS